MSSPAWYEADRDAFLAEATDAVVGRLSHAAGKGGWHVEPEQAQEWAQTVSVLREEGAAKAGVTMVQGALREEGLEAFRHVVLEYDFKRRGLRMDCVLLAPGVVVVIEFKRSKVSAADRDQVSNYAINLVEFHEVTQQLVAKGAVVVPIVALTEGKAKRSKAKPSFHEGPWASVLREPLIADRSNLSEVLRAVLGLRTGRAKVDAKRWISSRFSPSSTILDAAISLYGAHEVSAIKEHQAPVEHIRACTAEVVKHVAAAKKSGRNRIIMVSGAPGAGKTLVGLNVAFDLELRERSVFVTGNAPLVKVLNKALKNSYQGNARAMEGIVGSGYARSAAKQVIEAASFKIVAAHRFLGDYDKLLTSKDGSVVVFDEAQRTYQKGKQVLGSALRDHEANLILNSLASTHDKGAVVVALLGHNQAINAGERGAGAWFEAAEALDWDISIGDDTLALSELAPYRKKWAKHPQRFKLKRGHLEHSMRFYRNEGVEAWAHAALEGDADSAKKLAAKLEAQGHAVLVTRSLSKAKAWARTQRAGEQRAGLVASGQAKRLIAEGLYPNHKPGIEDWMLAPSHDIRSSDMLETVQNQYQIQGLELDWVVLCWGADLRYEGKSGDGWQAYKLRGPKWTRDKAIDVSKNGYRVLLTRARRGMVIYVPRGDSSGVDETREPSFYDGVAGFLSACGAALLG